MRDRPKEWMDRWLQFVGQAANAPVVPVALVQDGRGTSSREAAPFQCLASTVGNPTATQHWAYTFTPATPSKPFILRLCWLRARLETATSLIGVRIGTATAKAATNALFPIGDSNAALGGSWTADEITAANLPVTLFNLFHSETLSPHEFAPAFPYPEYFLEANIGQNQVLELICRTADDTFDLALGYYGLPIV